MTREECTKQLEEIVSNLNEDGIAMILTLMNGIDNIEKYNINTSRERIEEIERESLQKVERERTEQKKKREEEMLYRMAGERKKREETIASFTGRERKFCDKIEKVKNMNVVKYQAKYWQVELIAKLYNNNYINASYDWFCYGFYQGMQYIKNQIK